MSETGSVAENASISRQLTPRDHERIARNREKARALRSSRVVRPYPLKSDGASKIPAEKQDTGGGYLVDEDESESVLSTRLAEDPVLLLGDDQPTCKGCHCRFAESYLLTHFRYHVCDPCRDPDGKHSLVSRTSAKQEFLLKDVDLDERPTPLPSILRRNPHTQFGEMKLHLRCQVEERALSIWGSAKALEDEKGSREDARANRKQKKLDKDMKVLRKSVLSKKIDRGPHQHVFPANEEVHNEEEDTWTKTCTTCGYSVTFEKM